MEITVTSPPDVEFEVLGRLASGFTRQYHVDPRVSVGTSKATLGVPRVFALCTDILTPLDDQRDPVELKRGLDIETAAADQGVVWRLPEFDLVVEAEDDRHAEDALLQQFLLLKDAYVNEPDSNLTPAAVELKRRLLET
jgi:hypothetical protein